MAIARKTPEPVEVQQVAPRGERGDGGFGAVVSWLEDPGGTQLHTTAQLEMVGECSSPVVDDDTGDGLQQGAILFRHLIRAADEDAAQPVDDLGLGAGGDQAYDLVLEVLAIARRVLVPDHQIDHEPLDSPVGVGLHELSDELDVFLVVDPQENDRQVAGDPLAPQTGLPPAVLHQEARAGPMRGVGVEDRAFESPVELCVGLGDVELAQDHLAVRPRKVEHAVGQALVAILSRSARARRPESRQRR